MQKKKRLSFISYASLHKKDDCCELIDTFNASLAIRWMQRKYPDATRFRAEPVNPTPERKS